ncbi:replication initiation and membrane attachment family protein [Priestia endophytica]|uniref:replication initiation and membrane attachment family protein n=1 Tax=Priestia endophytica TaxID=135735 RepID=UPI002E224945|nr:DnaD domain protein [Priestia endophytica]
MTSQHWKELIAIDRYVVHTNDILHDYDRQIITKLYQPLIGPIGYSLYMTLWSQLKEKEHWGKEVTHHYLMAMMQCGLPEIYRERQKLEGIGLLKTFVKEEQEHRLFVYELIPPLTPHEFFNDGVLNIYLYNRLGKNVFQNVKQHFLYPPLPKDQFKDVTRSFNDTFQTLHMSEISSVQKEVKSTLTNKENFKYVGEAKSNGISLDDHTFDFKLFLAGLSDTMVPKKALTSEVREAIQKISFLYEINPIEMKNVVIDAIDENDEINIENLRKSAQNTYLFKSGESLPTLVEKTQPDKLKEEEKEPIGQNPEDELIPLLNNISPRELLEGWSQGAQASKADLQIIEDVMFKQKLTPGVVNVLIYYVMIKTDMKLSKSYVEKIASHWARKGIKTVKEAMDLAKNEHKEYQQWEETKKQSTNKKTRKPIRKEMVPDWLKEKEENSVEKPDDEEKIKEEERKMEEILKHYRESEE